MRAPRIKDDRLPVILVMLFVLLFALVLATILALVFATLLVADLAWRLATMDDAAGRPDRREREERNRCNVHVTEHGNLLPDTRAIPMPQRAFLPRAL